MEPVVLQAWWIFCSTLVFLMIVGFLLLESGWVERVHVPGIATKNVCILFASSLAFGLWGYGLMYGETIGGFCGNPFRIADGYDVGAYRFYQTGFASVAATILSGAIAGRTTLFSNVLISTIVAGVIYPIHGHWIWGPGGWLREGKLDAHDFAGAGAVHFVGGIAAWIACKRAGPRLVRPQGLPESEEMPHIAAAGVLILMIGWIGFNGGSAAAPGQSIADLKQLFDRIANYVQFTIHAAAAGAFAGFLIHAFLARLREPNRYLFSAKHVLTGAMGGMVAITAMCDYSSPVTSVVIGFVGGVASSALSWLIAFRFGLDDPVDAIAVHAGGGFAGMITVAIARSQHALGQGVDLICAAAFTWLVVDAVLLLLVGLERLVGPNLFTVEEGEQQKGLIFSDRIVSPSFNTFVLAVISVVAGALVVGAVLAEDDSNSQKITAISSVVLAFPIMFAAWKYLATRAARKAESSESVNQVDGDRQREPPENQGDTNVNDRHGRSEAGRRRRKKRRQDE